VILKEDLDRRGRREGEIVGLMREGLLEMHFPEDRIEVIHDEIQALERGMNMIAEDALLVVLADRVVEALKTVCDHPLAQSSPVMA
jgi:cyanophycin synthetase